MVDEILDSITHEDVLQAVDDFSTGAPHPFLKSTTYDVMVAGKRYPPKAIVGLAARRVAGRTLSPQDFRGGEGTRCFQVLRKLGFEVVSKPEAGSLSQYALLSTEEGAPKKFLEGATCLVAVNIHERNPKARAACIRHYSTLCVVCGFDFAAVYGEIGEGYIHVHHLLDLAAIGGEYEVDPIADLRPVCPNCHAMLHTETPAMTIDKLQQTISTERNFTVNSTRNPERR